MAFVDPRRTFTNTVQSSVANAAATNLKNLSLGLDKSFYSFTSGVNKTVESAVSRLGDSSLQDLVITATNPAGIQERTPALDRRIRVRPRAGAQAAYFYGQAGIMSILKMTNGVHFPFTPTVQVSHSASWSAYDLTHTNYQPKTYSKSEVSTISISGQFVANTNEEALYVYAATHFFKTALKMHFGTSDRHKGAPPPVFLLSGYGKGVFNDLPVVVTSFNQTMDTDVDYVPVYFGGSTAFAWIPAISMITIALELQPDPVRVRDEFNLDAYRTGQLFTATTGYI